MLSSLHHLSALLARCGALGLEQLTVIVVNRADMVHIQKPSPVWDAFQDACRKHQSLKCITFREVPAPDEKRLREAIIRRMLPELNGSLHFKGGESD